MRPGYGNGHRTYVAAASPLFFMMDKHTGESSSLRGLLSLGADRGYGNGHRTCRGRTLFSS